ncbi:lon-b peptidase [Halogeometricum pallidum JCM 14848]|uniref:Lon-b peptidase n=1 Tax=Halogeometricum pallidum JCM 14848 TaxID=1227487 RepID=M0CSN4_HALPD|nr:hypothetical protein [Halogeometricum pallidum]ELZ26275.1 lon-b peptidase [Halogeometricum pallidum JCM 14848]
MTELVDVLRFSRAGEPDRYVAVPAGEGARVVATRERERCRRVRILRALKWFVVLVSAGYAAVVAGRVVLGLFGAGLVHVLVGVDILRARRAVPEVVAADVRRDEASERYGDDAAASTAE